MMLLLYDATINLRKINKYTLGIPENGYKDSIFDLFIFKVPYFKIYNINDTRLYSFKSKRPAFRVRLTHILIHFRF